MRSQEAIPSVIQRVLPLVLCLGVALPSCGGGGGGGNSPNQEPTIEEEETIEEEDDSAPGPPPETVDESLEAFGVDVGQEPREEVDGSGVELPEDYAPLGTTFTKDRLAELFIARSADGNRARIFEDLTLNPPLNDEIRGDQITVKTLQGLPRTDPSLPQVFSDYAHGDLDGNGQEEIVGVEHSGGQSFTLWTMGDRASRYRLREVELATPGFPLHSIAVICGDFDADGIDEVAVAWGIKSDRNVFINFLGDAREGIDGLSFDVEKRIALEHGGFRDSDFIIRLAAGNVDFDPGHEVVAIVNTFGLRENAQLTVVDDQAAGHAIIGDLRPSEDQGICDVALGDVDGDSVEEIVCGGSSLESLGGRRDFLVVLDDEARGFSEMYREKFAGDDSPNGWVEVNTLNIDGDPQREIQVGNKLYDDLANGDPARLETIREDFSATNVPFNWNTSSVATGDFDGDNVDDIVVYYDGNHFEGSSYIAVHSFLDRQFKRLGRLDVRGDEQDQSQGSSIILMPDTDGDSAVLRTATDYKLVFTEPVVLAVLAAAPYSDEITQNVGSCSTVLGSSISSGFDVENSLSVSASVTVGVSLEDRLFTQSAFELEATLTSTLTVLTAESYEITQSVSFENGPDDDAVIFYSIPYDQYSYTIVSMPDDPETPEDESELEGTDVVLSLPRQPVLLKVERSFFNENVVDGSLRIGDEVLSHTVGDHQSYMSEADARRSFGSVGLFSQSQEVGQGSGANGVSIDVAEAHGIGGSLAVGFEVSAKVTFGGFSIGGSVGVESESGIVINSGSSTTYSGTVGDIEDRDSFGQNLYEWGLFTYLQTDPRTGQQFEIINYWVNPRD